MEFKQAALKRRMVRNFSDRGVDPEAIERILDLARRGPSAGYTQGQSFLVVTQPETKASIARCAVRPSTLPRGSTPSSPARRR